MGLSGCVVVSQRRFQPPSLDSWPRIAVKLSVAGVQMSNGDARSNPFDSPLASATFIVNDLCTRRQIAIEPGTLLITGHCCQAAFDHRPCPPHTVGGTPLASWSAGDMIEAEFDGLGSVSAVLED